MLKICKINACPNGTLGLHLSRAPWDPYPWVSGIQEGSSAEEAGMRVGDTVLEFNGNDVLGQKIFEIATKIREHWQSGATDVSVVIWRKENEADSCCSDDAKEEEEEDEDEENEPEYDEENTVDSNESRRAEISKKNRKKRVQRSYQKQRQYQRQHSSINQQSLQKFATCLQHIAQLLECPVCLEVIRSPGWQCCNGHVLCNNCRNRSVKCPVCRVPLGPRGRCLLADKLFNVLAESFPCDGVRSNRNSTMEQRKCSPESKECPQAYSTTREQQRSKQRNEQNQQQHLQQIKAKEMQQKDVKKVKTAVVSQKNVLPNEKVASKESTPTIAKAMSTTIYDVQQVNSNTTDDSNNVECKDSKKNDLRFEEAENGNSSSFGCRWQWRRNRTRRVGNEQQEQQQTNKILQVYKRYADEQLSNTVSRVMRTMSTTNGSS